MADEFVKSILNRWGLGELIETFKGKLEKMQFFRKILVPQANVLS